jgi:hypothetical protein
LCNFGLSQGPAPAVSIPAADLTPERRAPKAVDHGFFSMEIFSFRRDSSRFYRFIY